MTPDEVEVVVKKTIMHNNKIYIKGQSFSVGGGLATALVTAGLVELRDENEVDAEFEIVEGLGVLELSVEIEEILVSAGFDTIEKIQKAKKAELVKLPKIGDATAKAIIAKADEFIVED